jgi:hypothetical protein
MLDHVCATLAPRVLCSCCPLLVIATIFERVTWAMPTHLSNILNGRLTHYALGDISLFFFAQNISKALSLSLSLSLVLHGIYSSFTCLLQSAYRMDTLKKHLPVSVPEGLNELQKIAVRFEEKIYTAATSQVHLASC